MPYERQRVLAQELDERFPKIKGDIGQQSFRSAYYNSRMAGLSHAAAQERALAAVRRFQPYFAPVESTP